MKKLPIIFFALPLLALFSCQATKQSNQNHQLQEISTHSLPKNEILENRNFLETRNLETANSFKSKMKVALMLPMSGKNKDLGKALYNSAVMSLFDNDVNNEIELVLFDSKSTEQDAKNAINAIAKENIKLVIGPVFSSIVDATKDDIAKNELTVISLSNNQKLIDTKGIFLSGFFPEQQIERAVSYAISQGKYNFSAILPNNIYGKALADLMRNAVKAKNGVFITADFYNTSADNSPKIASGIVKSYVISKKLEQDIKNKNVPADFKISEEDKIRPQVIFIPEAGKSLSKMAHFIKKFNTDERGFQLIGTSQWDNAITLEDENLVGAWVASPSNERFRDFEKSYYQVNSEFPPRISSIIYDLIAVTIEVKASYPDKKDLTYYDFVNYKNAKNGFDGIDGLFKFLPNGLVQRNLAMLKIEDGKFITIEKAQKSFLKY